MKRIKNYLMLIAVLVLVSPSNVFAGLSFDLTNPNDHNLSDYPDLATFGTVGISVNDKTATFSIELAEGLSDYLGGGDNFGIDKFYWNTSLPLFDDFDEELWSFSNFDPTTWTIKFEPNGSVGSFGKFSFEAADPGQRVLALSFDATYSGDGTLTEESFNVTSTNGSHVAVHIGGFDDSVNFGWGSEFVADGPAPAPVPEPGTIFLLGFGFVALGLYRRKKT